MPRPGTAVIHPALLEQLAPIAESAQVGTCRLLGSDGTPGVMDPDTLEYSSDAPTVVWEGPCRFQPRSRATAQVVAAGEQPVTLIENQVTIPLTAPEPVVGQLLQMVDSTDSALIGKTFRISNVAFGDLQAERHLTVEDNETSRPTP